MQINNMKDTRELSKDIKIEMLKNNLNKQDMQKRLCVSYPTMHHKIELKQCTRVQGLVFKRVSPRSIQYLHFLL